MPETNAIIADLQARLETLETEFAQLKTLTDKVIPGPNRLRTQVVEAQMIDLKSPDGETQRVSICGHETGAWITLFDGKGCARLILSVDDGIEADETEGIEAEPSEYSIRFYGLNEEGESQMALRLGLNRNNGAVEVLTSTGAPAALMKGIDDDGGVFAVVDDEGKVCAMLRRNEGGGELQLFRSPLQKSVVLHAAPQGGALILGDADHAARAMMLAGAGGAMLTLNNDEERAGCGVRLMASDGVAAVEARDNASSHSAGLSAVPGRAFVEVERGAKGEKAVAFAATTLDDCNLLQLHRPDGSSGLMLQTSADSASVIGHDGADRLRFSLAAGAANNGLAVIGETGHEQSLLLLADERASLVINADGKPVAAIDTEENCGRMVVLGPRDGRKQVAMRAMSDQAGLSISESGGETMVQMWADDEGGCLQLCHRDGTQRVQMHSHISGGGVAVCGETGSARAAMGVGEDRGQVVIQAAGGDPMALLHSDEDGGQLTLFNDEGERTFTLPDDATLL